MALGINLRRAMTLRGGGTKPKPAAVYEKTRDAEVARILLGQQSLLATHRYLGLGAEDALAEAREIDI